MGVGSARNSSIAALPVGAQSGEGRDNPLSTKDSGMGSIDPVSGVLPAMLMPVHGCRSVQRWELIPGLAAGKKRLSAPPEY